ncbi:MAG: hypothetical protein IH874_09230 [Candidatus Dadabacteria bacterium]|nr:hypothetical protein [Candidatus Dadabacteria bacterium]
MDSKKIVELILEYPEGEISEANKMELKRHIRENLGYSELYEQSKGLWKLMEEWRDIEPSDDYLVKFWNRVTEEEEARAHWFGRFLGILRFNLGWSAAAIVTFLVLGVVSLYVFNTGTEMTLSEADLKDNEALIDVEKAISTESSKPLELYGPWNELDNPETGDASVDETHSSDLIRPVDFGDIY